MDTPHSHKAPGIRRSRPGVVRRALVRRFAKARQAGGPFLFACELFGQPSAVGAIWPSSRRLARNVASRVPHSGDGLVIELGGGTGVVTHALLQRGIAPGRLLVIERSAAFVRHLRKKFPELQIVHRDAAELARLLPPGARVDAIVSSLPLRSTPAGAVATIVEQWRALVRDRGIVIQFTYDLRAVDRNPLPGFLSRASDIVWANLPPARVMALERRCTERNAPGAPSGLAAGGTFGS